MKINASLILVSILLLTACGSKANPTRSANAPSVPVTGGTNVTIANYAFSPVDLTVKVGTTVTWTNKDAADHSVLAIDKAWGSGKIIKTGHTYSFTFTEVGTYPYQCGVHSEMKATITVVK